MKLRLETQTETEAERMDVFQLIELLLVLLMNTDVFILVLQSASSFDHSILHNL